MRLRTHPQLLAVLLACCVDCTIFGTTEHVILTCAVTCSDSLTRLALTNAPKLLKVGFALRAVFANFCVILCTHFCSSSTL